MGDSYKKKKKKKKKLVGDVVFFGGFRSDGFTISVGSPALFTQLKRAPTLLTVYFRLPCTLATLSAFINDSTRRQYDQYGQYGRKCRYRFRLQTIRS